MKKEPLPLRTEGKNINNQSLTNSLKVKEKVRFDCRDFAGIREVIPVVNQSQRHSSVLVR